MSRHRRHILAALDIGSSKVCAFIAKITDSGRPRVIGVGHQISHGMKAGNLVDINAMEHSILNAVHAAEQMAGETINSVYVNITGGSPLSHSFDVEMPLNGQEVREQDLQKILEHSRLLYEQRDGAFGANDNSLDRQLIHSIATSYSLDTSSGIRDPRGMYGQRLGANVHMISAQRGSLRNLTSCIQRCHLDIEGYVMSPYASGLASLVEDEMDLGVTLIDMGGGTTSFAVFFDGNLVYTDMVSIGGMHVTNDIARGLSTPVAQAERLKTLYGCALASPQDELDMINVQLVGEDEDESANNIPRSLLNSIIQPRIEETFEAVRSKLDSSGFSKLAGRRAVLTGGASQLANVRELATLVLDKQIRLGKPIRLAGLAEAAAGPAFSTCAGLLSYALKEEKEASSRQISSTGTGGFLQRIKLWVDENI